MIRSKETLDKQVYYIIKPNKLDMIFHGT